MQRANPWWATELQQFAKPFCFVHLKLNILCTTKISHPRCWSLRHTHSDMWWHCVVEGRSDMVMWVQWMREATREGCQAACEPLHLWVSNVESSCNMEGKFLLCSWSHTCHVKAFRAESLVKVSRKCWFIHPAFSRLHAVCFIRDKWNFNCFCLLFFSIHFWQLLGNKD